MFQTKPIKVNDGLESTDTNSTFFYQDITYCVCFGQ